MYVCAGTAVNLYSNQNVSALKYLTCAISNTHTHRPLTSKADLPLMHVHIHRTSTYSAWESLALASWLVLYYTM